MNTNKLTYEDFKRRISIQEVLQDAGYHLYRRDGLRYPSFVRLGSDGRRIKGDKFIVSGGGTCCFQPPERRNYNIISFIKEHPYLFSDYRAGMSKDRLVNLVCCRLLNQPIEERKARIVEPRKEHNPFRLEDYEVSREPWRMKRYFEARGINEDTRKAFAGFYFLAKKASDGKSYFNMSFPMVIPGQEGIVGLEQRGFPNKEAKSSYKGKAAGSNSSEGLWIANLTGAPLSKAKEILWFESAYDAMAEYQLNPVKSVFISTGGAPTDSQMKGVMTLTPASRHYLGFDKDEAGRKFVQRFKEIAAEIGFKNQISANHPLGCFKDWNDALLGKESQALIEAGEIHYDYREVISDEQHEHWRQQQIDDETYERKGFSR